jgi:hypothetical protein
MIRSDAVRSGYGPESEVVWTMPILPRESISPYLLPQILTNSGDVLLPDGRLGVVCQELGYERMEIVPPICRERGQPMSLAHTK